MTIARSDPDRGAIDRVPALDGVRGIAILLVLFLHFGTSADFPSRSTTLAAEWLDRLFYTGWSGVDLFFVLSGFLITSILVASKDQPQYFRRFYGRRALRIFPLYYAALVFTLFIVPRLFPQRAPELEQEAIAGQVWLWTYTLNIALAFGHIVNAGLLGHFWTLNIEEQYYLFWPWLVKALSARAVLIVCGALVVSALLGRLAWMALGFEWGGAYRFTLTRVDSLAVGSMIAVLVRNPSTRERLLRLAPYGLATGLLVVGAMGLAVQRFYPSEWLVVTFGHSALAVTFGCLVLFGLRESSPAFLRGGTLRALGKYSYGIYVWHWPLQNTLLIWYSARQALKAPGLSEPLVFLGAGVAGSIFLGWLSYRVIEEPFLALKRLFAYSDKAVARPQP